MRICYQPVSYILIYILYYIVSLWFSKFNYGRSKDTYTKDVHGKISDSASEGQIISAFLNKIIDI